METPEGDELTLAVVTGLLRSRPALSEGLVVGKPDWRGAVVLQHDHRGWPVFYSERGVVCDLVIHSSEHDACADALGRIGVDPAAVVQRRS